MTLVQDIDWRLVLKMAGTCVVVPWALAYLLLWWLFPLAASHAFWVLGGIVGTLYFATPAAAAYFSARAARSHRLVHAMLAVALGLLAYVSFFEDSLFAVAVWPVMGLLGALPFRRKSPAEA